MTLGGNPVTDESASESESIMAPGSARGARGLAKAGLGSRSVAWVDLAAAGCNAERTSTLDSERWTKLEGTAASRNLKGSHGHWHGSRPLGA